MRFKKRLTFLVVVAVCIFLAFILLKPYYRFLTETVKISPVKTLLSSNSIKKVDDKINILILGIAGGAHDGPNLTDSIIVANYDLKKNRILTISIPRDIWSDTLQDKINSAYVYGEDKQKGGGFKLARAEVSAIVGMPIQYAAVINFEGFDELIDLLNGVDIEVVRSFEDEKFPIEGKENDECDGDPEYNCRYEKISFKKGRQHMDGENALKFVRSRNAIGIEGSDFARSQRQQRVIAAVKTEMIDTLKSLNLEKIKKTYAGINAVVSRDISNQQAAILSKKIIFAKNFYQKDFHLSNDIFEVPDFRQYYGKYVLIPKDGDYSSIHKYVECLIEKESDKKCLPLVDEGEEND